jgi:hypothetical protein
MTRLPIAEWLAALTEMEAGLADTVIALDRYQAEWTGLFSDAAPRSESPAGESLLGRMEERLREWDARLAAATDLAASADRELADREVAVARWQGLVAGWSEVIQRGAGPTTPAGGPPPS